MDKKLPTVRKNDSVALLKSTAGLLKLRDKLITKNHAVVDESWMQRLWEWADENEIGDLEWVEDEDYEKGGFWKGFPREREVLLTFRELRLLANSLTQLPKEIGNLTQLEILNLWHNNLTKLPKELWNLTQLERLGLWHNNLTELPKEIGNLTQLKRLFLDDNKLTELPKEIGKLTNLTWLNLRRNNLTELPKEIGNLTDLTELFLKYNPNLILTQAQIEWIEELEANGCAVDCDTNLFDRENIPAIDINEDEILF